MSGRGRQGRGRYPGRGYGRGRSPGRGYGRGYGRGNYYKQKSFKKQQNNYKELKFAPHLQGKSSTATYASVKEAIIQEIQKTYKGGMDVSKCLKDMQKINLDADEPQREISVKTDQAANESEQKGFDIKYQEKLGRHLDRVDDLEKGLHKAYALIFTNYCTKAMQNRIEQHPDYQSTIMDDPIVLLETIKTLMHATVRAQYPLMTVTDALIRMVNIKQGENEPLLDFIKRFK